MTLEEVLEVARLGAAQGCTEALFTLGEWKLSFGNAPLADACGLGRCGMCRAV